MVFAVVDQTFAVQLNIPFVMFMKASASSGLMILLEWQQRKDKWPTTSYHGVQALKKEKRWAKLWNGGGSMLPQCSKVKQLLSCHSTFLRIHLVVVLTPRILMNQTCLLAHSWNHKLNSLINLGCAKVWISWNKGLERELCSPKIRPATMPHAFHQQPHYTFWWRWSWMSFNRFLIYTWKTMVSVEEDATVYWTACVFFFQCTWCLPSCMIFKSINIWHE